MLNLKKPTHTKLERRLFNDRERKRKRIEAKIHAPAGQPRGKRSPSWASEHSTPVVETTGSWVRGADLSHGQPHAHSEHSGHEPSVNQSNRAAESQTGVVRCSDPRENRYDGK